MIFNRSAENKSYLKETGANWLLRETSESNMLALDYVNAERKVACRIESS